jgi:hypothetical protein
MPLGVFRCGNPLEPIVVSLDRNPSGILLGQCDQSASSPREDPARVRKVLPVFRSKDHARARPHLGNPKRKGIMCVLASNRTSGMRGWRMRQPVERKMVGSRVSIGFRHDEHCAMETALQVAIVQGRNPNLFRENAPRSAPPPYGMAIRGILPALPPVSRRSLSSAAAAIRLRSRRTSALPSRKANSRGVISRAPDPPFRMPANPIRCRPRSDLHGSPGCADSCCANTIIPTAVMTLK